MLRDQFYKNINAQMIAELKIRKRVRELILEKSKERLSGEKLKKVQDEWTDDGSNAKRLNLKKEIAKYGYLINPKKDFIGEGAFGAVFTAVNQKKAPGKFAVKAIHKEDSKSTYVIYATSLEQELKNYEFFSNIKEPELAKHFPLVYETINNPGDEYAYVVMELLQKSTYDNDLIDSVTGESSYEGKLHVILRDPEPLLKDAMTRVQQEIYLKDFKGIDYRYELLKYMLKNDVIGKIGNHLQNLDFTFKKGDSQKVNISNFTKRFEQVENFRFLGKPLGNEMFPSRFGHNFFKAIKNDIVMKLGIAMGSGSNELAAYARFLEALVEVYLDWLKMIEPNIMNEILKFDISKMSSDSWGKNYDLPDDDEEVWVYDGKARSTKGYKWATLVELIKTDYYEDVIDDYKTLYFMPKKLDKQRPPPWLKFSDSEFIMMLEKSKTICSNQHPACEDDTDGYFKAKFAADFGEILGRLIDQMQMTLEKKIIKVNPHFKLGRGEAPIAPTSDLDKRVVPQIKSFNKALNILYAKYGIVAGDIHKYNLMIRPKTGDIVVPDVGMFDRRTDKKMNENKKRIIIEKLVREKIKHTLMRVRKRMIIREAKETVKYSSTGLNTLDDLFMNSNLLTTLETGFNSLTTSEEQRSDYKNHILQSMIDLLKQMDVTVDKDSDTDEMQELSEVLRRLNEEEEPDLTITVMDEDELPDDKVVGPERRERDEAEKEDEPAEDDNAEAMDPEADLTGRKKANSVFSKIEKSVTDYYSSLGNPADKKDFKVYILANLELYFQKWENSLMNDVSPEMPADSEQAIADAENKLDAEGGEEEMPEEGEEEFAL